MTGQNAKPREGIAGRVARSAPVRLVLFFVVLSVAYVGAQIALFQISRRIPSAHAGVAKTVLALAFSGALLGVYIMLVRWIERRAPSELALPRGGSLALGGAILGFALFCIVYTLLWVGGIAHWQGIARSPALMSPLILAILSATGEELVVRGGVFRILEQSCGTAVALLLSAALFGGLHMFNSGATPVSTVAIALEAGVLLGAAYAASGSLWLPIGLHFGWNFTESGVFGAAVSGGKAGAGIVNMPLSGSVLWTGGQFGPEASLVAVAVCLAAGLILVAVAIRRGRWKPLSVRLILD